MAEADTTNGESPEVEADEDRDARPGLGDDHGTHRTGVEQAEKNAENDPPA